MGKKTRLYLFIGIIAMSLVVRIIYNMVPMAPWWDSAVYVGMAKYIYSHGAIGYWEMFRPVLWPVIIGAAWIAGLSPFVTAQVLNILLAVGTVALVWAIGEKIRRNAGIFAAIILSLSPVYMAMTPLGITDIPSAFCTVLALYLFINNWFFFSGVVAAAGFMLRFPQGIILVPIFFTVVGLVLMRRLKFRHGFAQLVLVGIGFLVAVSPYLVSNYYFYGNPISPITTGNDVVVESANQQFANDLLYYAGGLTKENPFLLFGLLALALAVIKFRALRRKEVLAVGLSVVILGAYFSVISHKELRYGIAILPYMAVVAGAGIAWLVGRSRGQAAIYSMIALVFLGLLGIDIYGTRIYASRFGIEPERAAFFNFFNDKPNVHLITTTPQIVMYSDVYTDGIFDAWENAYNVYNTFASTTQYAAIDTCSVHCISGRCEEYKTYVLNELNKTQKIFDETAGNCNMTVWKLR